MNIFPGAKLMQVVEWGYPKGSLRPAPLPSAAYSVVHITANLATAENEAAWRINDPALQNSATFFVNRDGSVVQLLGDPLRMDPWSNGDVRSPDTSNPRIAAMVRAGVNANERTLVSIENVGNEIAWGKVPGGFPITDAQVATNARIIAHYHGLAGVPITRETVIGHYQLNSVTRANCPSRDKSVIDRIVAIAGEDPMEWVSRMKPLDPYICVTDPNSMTRNAPSMPSPAQFLHANPIELTIVGEVTGDSFAGSTRWLCYTSGTWGIGCTHESNEASRKPLSGGCTPEQLDAARKEGSATGFIAGQKDTKTKAVTEGKAHLARLEAL